MKIKTDSAGQKYIDVPSLADECVRLTFIDKVKAGYKADSVRVQIRDASGHLRQGPEVPLESVGPLFSAMIELLRGNTSE